MSLAFGGWTLSRVVTSSLAAAPPPATAAVLGPARAAAPAAAALALRVAAAGRRPYALLGGIADELGGGRAPARRAAVKAAGVLADRGLDADAAGRLVRVRLAAEDLLAGFGRAAAACEGPAVLLVTGPRTDELDVALAAFDVIVVAPAVGDDALAEAAELSLVTLGPPVRRATPSRAPVANRLALSGATALDPLRGAVAPALEVLA
jgi:hypothetical protein